MKKEIDYDKHIWEGWTVGDFVEDLSPMFDMIQNKQSWYPPFSSKEELRKWCIENQPYYKKHIPEVYEHFRRILNI